MKSINKLRYIPIYLFLIFFATGLALKAETSIYTNDMQYVLGDVKQAFIQDKISTTTQVEALLKGFKTMKVNGIRMPIFATGLCPNKTMFDYFFQRATEEGFPIFANPAQSSGGHRIANGVLNFEGTMESVKDDAAKTTVLINTVIAFASEYKCKWINPFNEDGKAGAAFSATQMNTIYSSLFNNLNGAELIGSCAWGIPASIDVLKNTNIENYITVSATHNLGFNHSSWTEFIALSKTANLPVWDSEVNHNDAYGTGTRLESALQYGVNGLVLYNTWSNISLTAGSVNNAAQVMMALYLKSNTAIENVEDNFFLSVFPNPAQNYIQLSSSDPIQQIDILDVNGKVLMYVADANNKIDISNLSAGIYFVKCKTNENTFLRKITKK